MLLFAKKACLVALLTVLSFWLMVKIAMTSLYQFDVSRFVVLNLNSTLDGVEGFLSSAPPEKIERVRSIVKLLSDERSGQE